MNFVKKLALVPESSVKQQVPQPGNNSNNTTGLQIKVPVGNLQFEIANILDRTDIPVATRMHLYQQLMQRLIGKRERLALPVPVTSASIQAPNITPPVQTPRPAAATPAMVFPHAYVSKPLNYLQVPAMPKYQIPEPADYNDSAILGLSENLSFAPPASSTPQASPNQSQVFETDKVASGGDLLSIMKIKMGDIITKHFRLVSQTELVDRLTQQHIPESNIHDIIKYIFSKSNRRAPVGTEEVTLAIYTEDYPPEYIINDKVRKSVERLYEREKEVVREQQKTEKARSGLYKPGTSAHSKLATGSRTLAKPSTTLRPASAAATAKGLNKQRGSGVKWIKF